MTRYRILGVEVKVNEWMNVDVDNEVALVIEYRCPRCREKKVTVWLFPSVDMMFNTNCCEMPVYFKGRTGDEK